MTKKRAYVVSIFAAVHTAEDTEMEHPSPILVKIPVKARSVEEAQEKVSKAIGKIAGAQQTDLEREEMLDRLDRMKRNPLIPRNPTHPSEPGTERERNRIRKLFEKHLWKEMEKTHK